MRIGIVSLYWVDLLGLSVGVLRGVFVVACLDCLSGIIIGYLRIGFGTI